MSFNPANDADMRVLRFVGYEVHAVKDYGERAEVCADAQADFYSIYGLLLNSHGSTEYVCVGDFSSRQAAELIVDLLSG
jgi:hypothetical protein